MAEIDGLLAMAGDPDPETRGRVASALGTVGGEGAFGVLVDLLSDADDRVRITAATSLGDLRDPNAVEPLLPLLEEESVELRCAALAALAQIADPRTFAPVVTRLFDTDDDIRRNAAAAVGCLRDPRALEPLLMCLDDHVEWVRANSAWSLGRIGCLEAVGRLQELADSDDTETVRANAVSAIGSLALHAGEGERPAAASALEYVATVLDDEAELPKVRISAMLAVAQAFPHALEVSQDAATGAFGSILALAGSAADDDLRSTAVWSLGEVCGKGRAQKIGMSDEMLALVRDALTVALDDPHEWCRRYAREALDSLA